MKKWHKIIFKKVNTKQRFKGRGKPTLICGNLICFIFDFIVISNCLNNIFFLFIALSVCFQYNLWHKLIMLLQQHLGFFLFCLWFSSFSFICYRFWFIVKKTRAKSSYDTWKTRLEEQRVNMAPVMRRNLKLDLVLEWSISLFFVYWQLLQR